MNDSEYKGVFDLSDAEGVNESERLLMRLCRKSFLSLWSYANLHTDQDMRNGKGSAKEFTDVLVVFGNDVILFSDKHITFSQEKPLNVAWKRWYKRAVDDSAKQLYGALNWLRRFPERVFLDAKCTRPLPVKLPPNDQARFHLVAITRGSLEACAKQYPGSIGTLQINTKIEGRNHDETPFTIGVLDRSKPFIHVFDEFSLEVVLRELDTATDFVNYLRAREEFLLTPETTVISAGEEQLIAAYLVNLNGNEHVFTPQLDGDRRPALILFDESHFTDLIQRPEYQEKKRADSCSYFWDELIERYIRLGDPAIVNPDYQQDNHETEQALRVMAAESRFRRRLLVTALQELVSNAQHVPGKRAARAMLTLQQPDLVYIFLIAPKTKEKTYDEYRLFRVSLLHAYCRIAKLKFPQGVTFVGIALDHPVKDYAGGSEDLLIYICQELTEQEREEVERYRKELGIFPDDTIMHEVHADEYPQDQRNLAQRSSMNLLLEQGKRKAKRKADIAKTSRRRNRKRK